MGIDTKQYPIYAYPINAVKYFACAPIGLRGFLTALLDGTLTGFSVSGLFQNNSDYVLSAKCFPFRISIFYNVSSTVSDFYIGNKHVTPSPYALYEINPWGNYVVPVKKWFTFTLTRTYNNFLDFAPYTKYKLYIPMFDTIELPLEKCYGEEIECYLSVDIKTGNGTISLIRKSDGIMIYTQTKELAIQLPIGRSNEEEQMRNRFLQTISFIGSIGALAMGTSSGNPLLTTAGVGMLTKNITGALQNEIDTFNMNGSINGVTSTYMNPKEINLICEQPQNITVPDVALKGGVCKKNLPLSSVTGYTEIGEIHFNPMGYEIYDDEISEIEQLLRNGVHL